MSSAARNFSVLWGILLFVAGSSQPLRSQRVRDTRTLTLRQMTRLSGYIFAGTVAAVERAPHSSHDVASMQVTFSVEQAIRGVRIGQKLVIREWAGAWDWGGPFRPGEHVLVFLYPPSKLGLTSLVGGTLGRFPVDQDGQVALPAGGSDELTADLAIKSRVGDRARVSGQDFARAIRRAQRE